MNKRIKILSGIIIVVVAVIITNLFLLMIIDSNGYRQAAAKQQLKVEKVAANRGTIYDANGDKLVESAVAWIVYLEPGNIYDEQREELCRKVSEITGLSYQSVLDKSYQNNQNVKLIVKIDKEQRDALNAYIYRDAYYRLVDRLDANGRPVKDENNRVVKKEEVYYEDHPELDLKFEEGHQVIKGIHLETDTKRYYFHNPSTAGNVLGFTNFDNEGSAGLEEYYNETLKGTDGRIMTAKDSVGGKMPVDFSTTIDQVDGNSLVLTIDANIQQVLEKYLRQAVKDNDVQNRAVGIIMNVNTGAILAMATMNDYDPANYLEITDEKTLREIAAIEDPTERNRAKNNAQNEQWKNKAVNDTYEPGSVFKPITMAAALEEGLTSLDEEFDCPGYKMIGKRRIKCHKNSGHGHETLTQGLMNSCNPVLMTLGERLGPANFFKYFKSFGLTASTGIDLPGESAGLYHTTEGLKSVDLAVSTFGQSFTVTPIQMITAFAAAANGGYLVQPYVVDKIRDADGNIIFSHQTVIRRQVISEETSKKVDFMLEATAGKGGTAHNVYLSGYRIGAKTGTSEKIAKQAVTKDGKNLYVASFCAVAPIDDPEIAILVVFDEPNNPRSHGGGTIVAPVVRGILSEVLPYIGVDEIYSDDDQRLRDTVVPNVVGKNKDEAVEELESKGFEVRVIGSGDVVTAQTPKEARNAPKSCTVVLTTKENGEIPTVTVPDLVGLSPTNVAYKLRTKNLNIRYSGTGYDSRNGLSRSQDIPAGSVVEQGTVITVEFTLEGITD